MNHPVLRIVSAPCVALLLALLGGAPPAAGQSAARDAPPRAQPYLVAAGRSPIPQPGETFDRPIPARRLVYDAGEAVVAPRPDGPVAWGAAHRYVGQRITVEGEIVDTYNHQGNVCFLNFSKEWRGKFYIPVFKETFDRLPGPPEEIFLNQLIRVTGTVTLHNNRPNIEVHDAKQIEVVRR